MEKFATPEDFKAWLKERDMSLGEFQRLDPNTKSLIYANYTQGLHHSNPGGPLEHKLVEDMCWQIHNWEKDTPLPPESRVCKVLSSTLFSAKSTLDRGSPRRVFIQDLAASLNRKGLLPNEKVQKFNELGYKYMESIVV